MKFSDRDVTILQNFAGINPSIAFKIGNVQRTVNPFKTVFAKAKLSSDIPNNFSVYDLNRLLRSIDLASGDEAPDIHMEDTHLSIKGANSKITYYYSSPDTIFSIDKLKSSEDVPMVNIVHSFLLTKQAYTKLIKAASTFGVSCLAFGSDQNGAYVETCDPHGKVKDGLKIQVSTDPLNKVRYVLSTDNIRLIAGNYSVDISDTGSGIGIVRFDGQPGTESEDLTYWVATEA